MISILSLFVCIIRVSSAPGFEDIKLISAGNCTFHSHLSLYSFINSLKYFSIRIRYSSSVDILSPLLWY